MAVHGYVTHAAYNRRLTVALAAAYVVAFEVIAVFCLTWFLLIWDHEHTVLSNPAGYALRYAAPVALITGLVFWWLYRGHADAVARSLDVRLVERAQEPRFVAIAEEQCTALGVRLPRFGIIEADEPNALTVGEGPNAGLIAVTRGLLATLDDDELAAVLAHEASHIRHGDTKVLAANHALMRTAVILQTHNIPGPAAAAAQRHRHHELAAPGAVRPPWPQVEPRSHRRRRSRSRHAFSGRTDQRAGQGQRPWRLSEQREGRGPVVRRPGRSRRRQPPDAARPRRCHH
jgi:hypothetical protein